MTTLVWFRNDLRIHDNPALSAACATNERVHALLIRTPAQWAEHGWSEAKIAFYDANLQALSAELAQRNITLTSLTVARFSDLWPALSPMIPQWQVKAVYCNQEFGINERRRDAAIDSALRAMGVRFQSFSDQLAVPVDALRTKTGETYKVFTPFFRAWQQWLAAHPIGLHASPSPKAALPFTRTEPLSLFGMTAGETTAHQALTNFLNERAHRYGQARDFPAVPGTSRLSPYLAVGVLSGRQCVHAAMQAQSVDIAGSVGISTWISELAWRDFYLHILYHFPRVSMHRAFRPETEALPWRGDSPAFRDWTQGMTGIPLVDAAMRQLNASHWMHNRLRMVSAMYLTKNLFIDWRLGEAYFMSKLIDGHLAANNGGWQWSASTGTDAAPYFRVFNPASQSERFDPNGEFIRHWIPEIAHLSDKHLHAPWTAPHPPHNYPPPQVDLKQSRADAIAHFKALKPMRA